MAKLEAVLERRGIASAREMSEAIARCELHGGDLTTSLLQFVNADEADLSAALSECHGLPAAVVGLLPAPAAGASKALPRELAERYCCFPLESGPGRLVLAVAAPLDPPLREELSFALGVDIEEQVALEVRIRQAISRYYGSPLSARNQRGIARLEGDLESASPDAFALWPDTQLSSLPRPPSDRPPPVTLGSDNARSEPPPVARGSVPPTSGQRASRRRAPFDLMQAREELARASSRDEVLEIFFGFASQCFEYSALFAVHKALAEGLDAWGPGADRQAVTGIGVPLDLPSSLSEAAESCKVRLTRLGREGLDKKLATDLRRASAARGVVLPVCLKGRCALLLYADNGAADVTERDIADVVALAPDAANALARIILLRKREAASRRAADPAEVSASLMPSRASARPNGAALAAHSDLDAGETERAATSAASLKRDKSRHNARLGSKPNAAPPPERAPEATSTDAPQATSTDAPEATSSDAPYAAETNASAPPTSSPSMEAPSSSVQTTAFGSDERSLDGWDAEDNEPEPAAWNEVVHHGEVPSHDTSSAESDAPILLDRPSSSSADEPVFLLARPSPRPRARPTAERPLRVVPKPPTSITRPARSSGSQPRLPSVIVNPAAAEASPSAPPVAAASAPAAKPSQSATAARAAETQSATPQARSSRPRDAAAPAENGASHDAAQRATLPSGASHKAGSASKGAAPSKDAAVEPIRGLAQRNIGPAKATMPATRNSKSSVQRRATRGAADASTTSRPGAAIGSSMSAASPNADAKPGTTAAAPAARNKGSLETLGKRSATGTSPGMPLPQAPPPWARSSGKRTESGFAAVTQKGPRSKAAQAQEAAAVRRPAIAPPPAASLAPPSTPGAAGAATSAGAGSSAAPPKAPAFADRGPTASPSAEPFGPSPSAPPPTVGLVSQPAVSSTAPSAPPVSIAQVSDPSKSAAPVSLVPTSAPPDSAPPSSEGWPMPESARSAPPLSSLPPTSALASEPAPTSRATASANSAPTSDASDVSAASVEPPSSLTSTGPTPSQPPPSSEEIERLVELACQGNGRAAQELARIGAPTVPQLMARFPGPVISERAGPNSRASECGPLLSALANIGSPAMPDITRSSVDRDARVRRWATLLLGELPSAEACRAVVQRLADEDPRVHQAALDAARLLLGSSAANLFRKTLFEIAEAEDAPLTLRLRTLEHVAKLKDSASVPRLIGFLTSDVEPIVHKALWALSVVTRHDFGRDVASWWDFWHEHQGRHRLEWLIEALDHRDPRLRKAAAEELALEARNDFGYSESLPPAERQEAQERYRKWWHSVGAQRFGRLA